MSFGNKLKWAGSEPYRPEAQREDISQEEFSLLAEDETYLKLAEVRWLADILEQDLSDQYNGRGETVEELFKAVAVRDAPLQKMVDEYVDSWLVDHREEVSD